MYQSNNNNKDSYTEGPLLTFGMTGTSGGLGMSFSWEFFSEFEIVVDFCSVTPETAEFHAENLIILLLFMLMKN